jgi:hypothetical protein
MSAQRLYLAGPMTGLPDFNYPAFNAAAAQLRAAGYTVVNPAENGLPATAPWADHMRADIIAMLHQCNAVALLPGYETSKGAQLELHIAKSLRWPVMVVQLWLDIADRQEVAA